MKTKLLLVLLLCVKTWGQIPTNNLDSEYKFTNGSLNDTFGTAENLTKTGSAATFTTDRFSGVTPDAINLAGDYLNRIPLVGATNLSVSFWLKSNTNDANLRVVMEQSQRTSVTNTSSDRGWYVYLKNGIVTLSCNYLWQWTASGGTVVNTGHTGWWDCTSNTNIADNSWHHVVITITGRSYYAYTASPHWAFENQYKIYIDNVLKNTVLRTYDATAATGGNGTSFPDFLPNNNIVIGNNSYANVATNNKYLSEIDDIRFYKSTLTAGNVTSLFNETAILSRNDFNSFTNFTIYPNPSKNIINIRSSENIEKIEIYTFEGKKIKSYNVNNEIDISDLSSGIYLLKIMNSQKEVGIKKLIKE